VRHGSQRFSSPSPSILLILVLDWGPVSLNRPPSARISCLQHIPSYGGSRCLETRTFCPLHASSGIETTVVMPHATRCSVIIFTPVRSSEPSQVGSGPSRCSLDPTSSRVAARISSRWSLLRLWNSDMILNALQRMPRRWLPRMAGRIILARTQAKVENYTERACTFVIADLCLGPIPWSSPPLTSQKHDFPAEQVFRGNCPTLRILSMRHREARGLRDGLPSRSCYRCEGWRAVFSGMVLK